ncbi:MAG TPA: 30S ribosomal protein S12 methylthiotransferase RimO [Smithellaceae bacterium]|mgnify:CR=1 FL=1|nr:30S ribosomal protein S12 methylthiotransferase RimO [Smithellaceae bacterium]HRS89255.1 30S ribosomal protein S12 methylthiotransferase RimO [Smithellaceae bacterium]HRV26287.1 30S ribosomal protein S12 methylthiotransferase RimO [Smithellaceae bacterium]
MKKEKPQKVHFISLGCPKNLIDSEVMAGLLNKSGRRLTQSADDADIVIVNTCGFIDAAKEESLEEILTLAQKKKSSRQELKIVVAGCLAQRYGKELLAEIPEVDLFIGTGEVGNIVRHVNTLKIISFRRTSIISKPQFLMNYHHPRIISAKAASAYLKISDGCSNCCSYCTIPAIRGRARSRMPKDILHEADNLASRGVKEIIITGQDTTAYGKDLKNHPRLAELLTDMTHIKGIRWIRLLYAHPAHISKDVMEAIATENKICSYIDLPIQHIDDHILRAMNRRISGTKIKEVISRARQIIPDLALRTSLIVGFPGETQKRFEKLLNFVRETKFDHLGVFTYSREEGTTAAKLKSQVSEKEKQRRRDLIMSEQVIISHAINQGLIGSVQEVLIENKSDRLNYYFTGRCRRQAPEIDGITYIKKAAKAKPGKFVKCRITAADDYDLFGEII